MARPPFAETYHRQTKYHPETIGMGHSIDFKNPPAQFKEYPGAPMFDLRPFLPTSEAESWQAESELNDKDGPFSLPVLSRLLFATNGVTAIAVGGGMQHYFRAAPSAGALYPTDLYLCVRDHADLPDGILYYHVKNHSLVEVYPKGLAPSGDELFERLAAACFDDAAVASASVAVVATCVFWRSAWRYGERGYRRCLLDSGHVLGNFDIVAPRLGLGTTAVGGFVDAEVNELLAVPEEKEGALAVFPLHEVSRFDELQPGPAARASESDEPEPAGDAIRDIHAAGTIRGRDAKPGTGDSHDELLVNPKYESASGVKLTPSGKDMSDQVELAILRRRSTRALSGEPLTLPELSDILAFACRPDLELQPPFRPRLFDPSLLETFVVVNAVEDVEPGVYYFAPGFMELLQVHRGSVRQEIHNISLGQELARDAAAVLIHTADLKEAVQTYGSRAYRYLHLDAGHIGQRVNVAAIHLELGVSGIGGFFDDHVNRLLDIPENELCVYITCLGRPAS